MAGQGFGVRFAGTFPIGQIAQERTRLQVHKDSTGLQQRWDDAPSKENDDPTGVQDPLFLVEFPGGDGVARTPTLNEFRRLDLDRTAGPVDDNGHNAAPGTQPGEDLTPCTHQRPRFLVERFEKGRRVAPH